MIVKIGKEKVSTPMQAKTLCRIMVATLGRDWMPGAEIQLRPMELASKYARKKEHSIPVMRVIFAKNVTDPDMLKRRLQTHLGDSFLVSLVHDGLIIQWLTASDDPSTFSDHTNQEPE